MNNETRDFRNVWCLGYVKEVAPRNARGVGGCEIALISYYVLTARGQLEEEKYYFSSPAGRGRKYLSVCASTLDALGYSIDGKELDGTAILAAFNDLRESGTRKRGTLVRAKIGESPTGVHTNYFEKVTYLTKNETLLANWLEGLATEDLARELGQKYSARKVN